MPGGSAAGFGNELEIRLGRVAGAVEASRHIAAKAGAFDDQGVEADGVVSTVTVPFADRSFRRYPGRPHGGDRGARSR